MKKENNGGAIIITGISGLDAHGNKAVRIYKAPEGIFMTVSWPSQIVQEMVDEGGYFPLRKSDEKLITSCGRIFFSRDALKEAVVGLRFEKALKDADYASFKNFGRNDIRLASAIAEVESERNQELMEDALDIIIGFKIHY